MSAVKLVLLQCDKPGCSESVQTPCDSTAEARLWAKEWTSPTRSTDLCPAHAAAAAAN
jgi:hypothetical protein